MNKVIKGFSIAWGIILTLSAFLGTVVMVAAAQKGDSNLYGYIMMILKIMLAIFGAYYVYADCSKKGGKSLYKSYMALGGAIAFLTMFTSNFIGNIVLVAGLSISFAGYEILAMSTDLGVVKSKIISAVAVLINIGLSVYVLTDGKASLLETSGLVFNFILCIAIYIFVCAKYVDKAERGSK